jgi:hypothetical protein
MAARDKPLSPFEQFHAYITGWYCGAGVKVIDRRFTEHERVDFRRLYNDGYEDGCKARVKAQNAACKKFKYTPNILRTQ